MKNRNLVILASASPQRRSLLRKAGVRFRVVLSGYHENLRAKMRPIALAKHLALRKALTVAKKHPAAIVIGADTIVVLGKSVFGKPRTHVEARRMLKLLSGRWHRVISAFAIVRGGRGARTAGAAQTFVEFRALTDAEIDAYVRTGEGMQAAGGYAIQKYGKTLVVRRRGRLDTILGMPVAELKRALRQLAPSYPHVEK